MPSHFKFKEYCPMVFRNLRERFNVDDEVFMVRTQQLGARFFSAGVDTR